MQCKCKRNYNSSLIGNIDYLWKNENKQFWNKIKQMVVNLKKSNLVSDVTEILDVLKNDFV